MNMVWDGGMVWYTSLESVQRNLNQIYVINYFIFRHAQTTTVPQTNTEVGHAQEQQMDTSATRALTKTVPQTNIEVGCARERQMDTGATRALTKTVPQTSSEVARAAGLPMGMLGTMLCAVCCPQRPQDCNLSTRSFDLVPLV